MRRVKRFIAEIHRGGLWQVTAAYIAGSLAVLEAVDLFSQRLDLPAWLFTVAVALLLAGFPIGILVAREIIETSRDAGVRAERRGREHPEARAAAGPDASGLGPGERPDPALPTGVAAADPGHDHDRRARRVTWHGAGVAFIGALAVWGLFAAGWMVFRADERRALDLRARALAELPRLADAGAYEEALALADEVTTVLPGDTLVDALRPRFASLLAIETEPPGATVQRKPYHGEEWGPVGSTPINAWVPYGASRLRFEKEGYRPAEVVHFALSRYFTLPAIPLDPLDSDVPEDMVPVPGGPISVGSPGLEHLPTIELADYHLDRYEVTNREYARFVEAGGYQDARWWDPPFRDEGHELSFEDAVARFVDRTGRPGPATWEAGTYPPGRADHPVGGLSWYEAAAYARFAGEALPTVYHWFHAAVTWLSPFVVAGSNYSGEGTAPVGAHDGMARFGAYDMGGNVREWVWNEGGGDHYILGGGWNDESYTFVDPVTQPPFDRSPTNGVRLARFSGDAGLEAARAPIPVPFRDYRAEEPVGDAEFALFRRLYEYDRGPLNPVIELTDTTDSWIRQRVSFDAAYGGERMIAHVLLPRTERPPYPTILFFPGSYGFLAHSSEPPNVDAVDFIVRSGRALLFPVLKSTFERSDGRTSDQPDMTVDYRDHMIMWAKDMRRTLDYAESRGDLDTDRLAYFGLSWGARLGGLMVPVEPRFDAAVLYVAGLKFQRSLPEADPWHFLPRFTVPVLMLNGRHDNFFPLETSQKPMFERIGTAPEHKRHVVYDGGHFVPRPQLIRETLDWLDRYLGDVR